MDDLIERFKIGSEVMKTENISFMSEYIMNVLDSPRVALEKKS